MISTELTDQRVSENIARIFAIDVSKSSKRSLFHFRFVEILEQSLAEVNAEANGDGKNISFY